MNASKLANTRVWLTDFFLNQGVLLDQSPGSRAKWGLIPIAQSKVDFLEQQ